jgi:hypothetical protein
MLETTVDNGSQELGLEQEVSETGGVDSDVGALLLGVLLLDGGGLGLGIAVGARLHGGGGESDFFAIGVVEEFFFAFVGHSGVSPDGSWWGVAWWRGYKEVKQDTITQTA